MRIRRTALASALAMAIVASARAPAGLRVPDHASRVVLNCEDHGTGSLRDAVAHAMPGGTVDLSSLTCGTISLSTGAIAIGVHDLTIRGPGAESLTIDGGSADRVLYQGIQGGSLSVEDLTITHGSVYQTTFRPNISGGCIYAKGDLTLTRAIVTTCSVYGPLSNVTTGGAVYAQGRLVLTSSTLTQSVVQGFNTAGGGAFAYGGITARYSTISFNLNASPNPYMRGGGLDSVGDIYVFASTVAYNVAGCGGGIGGGYYATIINSTIVGNVAQIYGGGMDDLGYLVTISNSTIAFNRAEHGGGIIVRRLPFGLPPFVADVESSIIADNVATLDANSADLLLGRSGASVIGANDLIVSADVVPPGTIRSEPMLTPLGNFGGPTMTLALLAHSPAIDRGDNLTGTTYDQRGPGYPRVIGSAGDIGAYEVQIVDAIFSDGFDD